MHKCTACALLALVTAGAGAQSPKPAEVWFNPGHVALAAGGAGDSIGAEWQFDRADNGDVRITKKERRGDAKIAGTVLSICSDQALLLKDIEPARGRELYELNEPVLYLQLVLRLLARAMPDGLPAAGSEAAVDTGDEKNTLRLRKDYSARKDIGAPWRVRGTARRSATGVSFDLLVTYIGDAPPHLGSEMKLSGLWEQQSRMPALSDAFSVAGWRVHRVDVIPQLIGGNTVLDSVAKTTPLEFRTLGEVRETIGRWWDPDVKAPRRAECKV
jgi:hypothetical protein